MSGRLGRSSPASCSMGHAGYRSVERCGGKRGRAVLGEAPFVLGTLVTALYDHFPGGRGAVLENATDKV